MSYVASNEGAAGEPAFPATAHAIFLDHKVRKAGIYDAGADRTFWQFDFPYLPTKGCHLETGTVFTPTRIGASYQFYAEGDYSEGDSIFGRTETMDIYFSRPFPRDAQGRILYDARCQIKSFTVHWINSVAFDVIAFDAPYPQSGSTANYFRHQLLDILHDDNYGVPDAGSHRLWVMRSAENCRIVIFNNTVRPCTIVGVEFNLKVVGGVR